MANIRQAFFNKIKASSTVINLLADGANSVVPAGRVSASTSKPCIAVKDAGRSGGPRRLPFFDALFLCYIFDDAPSAQAVSYVNLDAIADALKQAMHGASLTVAGQERVFQCFYDNYESPDTWDDRLECPYRIIRFRVPGVLLYDYRS